MSENNETRPVMIYQTDNDPEVTWTVHTDQLPGTVVVDARKCGNLFAGIIGINDPFTENPIFHFRPLGQLAVFEFMLRWQAHIRWELQALYEDGIVGLFQSHLLEEWGFLKVLTAHLEEQLKQEVLAMGATVKGATGTARYFSGRSKVDWRAIFQEAPGPALQKQQLQMEHTKKKVTIDWKAATEALGTATDGLKAKHAVQGDPYVSLEAAVG